MTSLLMASVWQDEDHLCAINITRGAFQPEFGESEQAILQALMPHLTRAFGTSLRLAQAGAWAGVSEAILQALPHGALILDERGRLLFVNALARSWTTPENGLSLSAGRVTARASGPVALEPAIASAAAGKSGATLSVTRAAGRPLSILVLPLHTPMHWSLVSRPCALMLITDPDAVPGPPDTRLRDAFGFTAAERAFSQRLIAGDSVQDAAAHLGIGIATARQHLSRANGEDRHTPAGRPGPPAPFDDDDRALIVSHSARQINGAKNVRARKKETQRRCDRKEGDAHARG